jgi:hypothetical protein
MIDDRAIEIVRMSVGLARAERGEIHFDQFLEASAVIFCLPNSQRWIQNIRGSASLAFHDAFHAIKYP